MCARGTSSSLRERAYTSAGSFVACPFVGTASSGFVTIFDTLPRLWVGEFHPCSCPVRIVARKSNPSRPGSAACLSLPCRSTGGRMDGSRDESEPAAALRASARARTDERRRPCLSSCEGRRPLPKASGSGGGGCGLLAKGDGLLEPAHREKLMLTSLTSGSQASTSLVIRCELATSANGKDVVTRP